MAERIDRVAEETCERAFLYADPDSFRAGVREALRAIEAALPQPPGRQRHERAHERTAGTVRRPNQPVEGAVETAAATL
jgi:hypothetical protein